MNGTAKERLAQRLDTIPSHYLDLNEGALPRALYLFGAGTFGREALHDMRREGIEILGFLDNEADEPPKPPIDGVPVFSPYAAEVDLRHPVVLTPHDHRKPEMVVQLAQMGAPSPYIGYIRKGARYAGDGWAPATQLLDQRADEIMRVVDMLEDEESVVTYLSFIKSLVEGDWRYLHLSEYPEYLHPVTAPRENDVILDLGAFNGDTAIKLYQRADRHCRIHCFEPSKENYEKLLQTIARNGLEGEIIPVNKGAWSEAATLHFSTEGIAHPSGYRINEDGNESIEVIDPDHYVEAAALDRVTVIKADIEGAEMNALNGARSIITRWRPRLLFSIYHSIDDLLEIPVFVRELVPEYRLYIGHHHGRAQETILYAIANRDTSEATTRAP